LGADSGLIGGDAYYTSLSTSPGTPSIIYAGRCYQSYTKPGTGKTAVTYWRSFDLRTGELFWDRPLESGESAPTNIELNSPQVSTVVAGEIAQMGYSVSLLSISGGYVRKYNPYTGVMSSNTSISPLTSAGIFYNNEYALTVQDLGASQGLNRYRLINWTTYGANTNFTTRIAPRAYDALGYMGTWNISWPRSSLGQVDLDAGLAATASWGTPPGGQWCIGATMAAFDLRTGNSLWSYTTNDTLHEGFFNIMTWVVDRGKIAFAAHNRHWTCFDGRTGKRLWESELAEYPWGNWPPYATASYDFNETEGAIITSTYVGVYAIDWGNGKIIWDYRDPRGVPFENPYTTEEGAPTTPFQGYVTIADGKVYAYNSEHTQSLPRARDWKIHCINATTGELIWQILNPMVPGAVADGYLTAANNYDGYMYVFGKGKSQTTVTAEPAVIAEGATMIVKGTVLDQSPGQPGTPCVSAASMATQMEYLHLQMPIDGLWHNETITGVPVTLTAIGSDGSVIDIGTTTTNGYGGTFGMAWTPTKEDTYTIMASFAGDDSYGSSMATTTMAVSPAPPAIDIPEVITPVDYTMTIAYAAIAIIVAVVIAVAVAVLLLRKR
jgi:outer membrane protein assembly factor BamB